MEPMTSCTERVRAQEDREKLEAQLQVSQKMEAIGRLAGGVAHDFNNLLSVILSYTEFAMANLSEGDPLKSDLLEVKKAGERAAGLTRQLLAFGSSQWLLPVPLDLNRIAEGVEKMVRRILGEDIDFVQDLAPDLGVVRADPGQMEQVLMNLVVNAREAMPEGGSLTIETSNADIGEEYAACHAGVAPGAYVQIAVTDTGCGIDGQAKDRIFEPFFTTKGRGTGLGLSTVYGIVKQSGGNIWVGSEPGHGTTFKIYLPRELSLKATAPRLRAIATPATGSETILVVEDDADVRAFVTGQLSDLGYRVIEAADGPQAQRILDSDQPLDLLFTDVVMPGGMTGRQLADAARAKRPGLKAVFTSGYTENSIVHQGKLDKGVNFLSKPFRRQDLARKVRETLDG